MLIGEKDAGGHSGATGSGVACALASTPERFQGGSVATVILGDSVRGFNMVSHVLVYTRVESQVSG